MKQKNWMQVVVIISILLCANLTVTSTSIFHGATDTEKKILDKDVNQNAFPSDAFDQKIMLLMKLAGFPSLSACIIQDDQVIWANGYGYYDLSNQKPATIDTIYLLASITKTIVGTAIMQLYEQDYFALDDDVNRFLPFELRNPHFPNEPITFRMLLSHTSSLNTNTQNEYYWFNFSGDPPFDFFPDPYLKEFLLPDGAYYTSTVWSETYPPGEKAMYANIGFDLLSYLVEIISGEPFLEYCDQYIFDPLEMHNTSFNLSELPLDHVAIPYQRFLGNYYTINKLDFWFDGNNPPGLYWRPRFYPAGGLYSTVSDLSHFLIAHMNDGLYLDTLILKEETVQLMHELQPDNEIGYGLAWMHSYVGLNMVATGHGGDIHGVDTWMLYNQSMDTGVIYLANGNPAYSRLPLRGIIPFRLILYSLFTKEGVNHATEQSNDFDLRPSFFFQSLTTISNAAIRNLLT